jgi:hypothetical protein
MTDTTYGVGSDYSGAAQTGGVPTSLPIPPPATIGGVQDFSGYAPLQGERTAVARRSRKYLLGGVAAVVAAVAIALLLAGVFKSSPKVTTIQAPESAAASALAQAGLKDPGIASVSGRAPFVLHYPTGWTQLTAGQLAKIANAPAAGLIAEGGRALLLVRPKQPLTQSLVTLSTQLTKSLSSSFADFKLLSTGTIRTLAGPAWVYTFERSKHGLVQSEVVISTSKAAYEIDIALRGGANVAAGQIGEIVHSFQT